MMTRVFQHLDRFLFASCNPFICVLLRILLGMLLLIYVGILIPDGARWFSHLGVLTAAGARNLQPGYESLLFWISDSPAVVDVCLWIMLVNALLLMLGCFSRFQAICLLVWLVSFQHRNPLLFDGEDSMFRLLTFFLIFMPLDCRLSLSGWLLRKPKASFSQLQPYAWPIRLVQLQMLLVYLSAAWCKSVGQTWQDGSAVFYVYQMHDLFGRGPLPSFVTETEWIVRLTTWSVVLMEAALPFGLCFRPTRKVSLLIGIGLHLSMEYAMNLFLFQWVMIVGLLAFFEPRDWLPKRISAPFNLPFGTQKAASGA